MGVIDHDTGRLVWADERRDATVLGEFFCLLGMERCARIRLADLADWVRSAVVEHCCNATLCADPFHVVKVRHEAPCIRVG